MLSEIAKSCAEPEIAIHFHVYREGKVLLQWHDAFSEPIALSGEFPEEKVKAFAEALSMKYDSSENM